MKVWTEKESGFARLVTRTKETIPASWPERGGMCVWDPKDSELRLFGAKAGESPLEAPRRSDVQLDGGRWV